MANIDVTIVYNPAAAAGSQWSLSGDDVDGTVVEVNDRGNNPITWDIALASGAAGSIAFGDPGIVFDSGWVGDAPRAAGSKWMSALNNTLNPNSPAQSFEYTINAVYSPGGSAPPVNVSWDPEVEENPPAQVRLKTT